MRLLIATDAWLPQINGVVRTLQSVTASLRSMGVVVEVLTPEGFASVPIPTYSAIRVALPRASEIARRVEAFVPDVVHIATEGPIGICARAYCLRRGVPFNTSFTTKFPEYISARLPIPESWSYAVLRRFHGAGTMTTVSTPSLMAELRERGFRNLGYWTRGVDTELFRPERAIDLGLPRPIYASLGRIAVEKNLEAFLSLDLPGSKVVIGHGPQEEQLKRKYPDVHFLGMMTGETLAAHLAAADVFVFPSKTDTFGLVQLEALASGLPVAAFPVTGPRDVLGSSPVGVLDWDLRQACLKAREIPREACRAFALAHSWDASARQLLSHAERTATLGSKSRVSMRATQARSRHQNVT